MKILPFLTFSSSFSWIARWPLALLAGIGTGIAIKGTVGPMILQQLTVGSFTSSNILGSVNNVITAVATFTTLTYFTFTFKQHSFLKASSKLGRTIMMVSFGVILGGFIMTAIGYSIGLMFTLMKPPALYVVVMAILMVIVHMAYSRAH